MRLTYPFQIERLGAVRIFGLQRVFELESGPTNGVGDSALSWGTTVCHVPASALESVQRRMAIVVPCKNERLRLLEGVLCGIPHECLLVFVSNSDREPVDRFAIERDTIERFCRFNQRTGIVVHQRDPVVGEALAGAGLPEVVDSSGAIRHGKGEAMMLGIAIARLADRDLVGFVDADNYVPGSVTEYVNAFAADFQLANTPYSMVRINWRSKPKVVDGALFFSRFGRASESTDRYLNLFLSNLTGFGTEAIRTGNAGEHAMSMDLALDLHFATGFAVEPFELIEIFERFGGLASESGESERTVMRAGVDVFQVETQNPHFHEDKGDIHVAEMRHVALAGIHRSALCPSSLRAEIEDSIRREGDCPTTALSTVTSYPPLSVLDWERLSAELRRGTGSLEEFTYPNMKGIVPAQTSSSRRTPVISGNARRTGRVKPAG
ncbi:MAG TPA: mannosyl-3-phosphoglycerate synthase [Acidimicrobiia bacterium]|nr:mannosyl-3-phosphoglycerate synthase [Acidimicrobiia bacterium]